MGEVGTLQGQNILQALQDLTASGMKQEAIEVRERQVLALQESAERRLEPSAQQHCEVGTEDHAKSIVLDVPAHDVLGLAPEVLARSLDRGARRMAIASRTARVSQHHSCGPVAEQRGGDEHRHAVVLSPETERAEVDAEEEHICTRSCASKLGGAGKTRYAAATTEAENREAFDIAAEVEPVHQ